MQDDIWFDQRFEISFLNFNAITPRRKIREKVFSDRIGLRLIPNICVQANDRDLGGDDSSFGNVRYTAGERSVRGLGADCSCKQRKTDDDEERPAHRFIPHIMSPMMLSVGPAVCQGSDDSNAKSLRLHPERPRF